MGTIAINTNADFDDALQLGSFAMPTSGFTFDLQIGLPSNWVVGAAAVPIVQYGAQSAHTNADFSISTWSDFLDVYIGGTRFDTTIPVSALIGSTHRVTITWDGASAHAYMDGVAKGAQTLTPAHAITSGGPLVLGAGNSSNTVPVFSFGDLNIYSGVNITPGSTTGLVGSWTASSGTLVSMIGGASFALDHHAFMENLGALSIGSTASHSIERVGDHDRYTVDLVAGQTYTFAMVGVGATHLRDPFLNLYAPDGVTLLAGNNDAAPNLNAWFTYTPTTSGAFYLDAFSAGSKTGQYGVSATLGTQAKFDDAMGAGIIDSGYALPGVRGSGVTITYGFQANDPGERANFVVFNDVMQAATREILRLYSDITGVTFVDKGVTDNADMRFSAYDQSDGSGGHAHYPSSTDNSGSSGDVHLNYGNRTSIDLGSYTWMTLLHEIGHALGLSHPGDYGTGGLGNLFLNDSIQYTNLSYSGPSRTGGYFGAVGGDADTPMLYDIMALQLMYGANMNTRTGDTVYGFNSNAGSRIYDFTQNGEPGLCIWDGGGNDTLDVSLFTQNQNISLVSGAFSDVGGLSHNVSIALGAIVENAAGGRGNDAITGNDAANALRGGDGNDAISGGLGDDTLNGGRGNDLLEGGKGNDILSGDGGLSVPDPAIYGLTLNAGGTGQSIRKTGMSGLPQTGMTIEFDIRFAATPVYQWFVAAPGLSMMVDPTNTGAAGLWVLLNNSWTYSQITVSQLGDGNSHRISFAWDSATGAYAHYLDGSLVTSGTGFQTGVNLNPTGAGSVTFNPVGGAIGDIRLYSRALSAAEILATAPTALADPVHAGGLIFNWQVGANGVLTDAHGGAAPTVASGTGAAPAVTTLVAVTSFNDTLNGGDGNDRLDGGVGNDLLSGGAGDDIMYVDSAGDAVMENASDGSDTVYASVDFTLPPNVEVLNLTGTAIRGAGNSGAYWIYGNANNNSLDARTGVGHLFGGAGNDIYYVDSASDGLAENFGEGTDTVYASIDFALPQNVEVLNLTGSAIRGVGNSGEYWIYGNANNNSLDARGGTGHFFGGAGNDVYFIDSAGDGLAEDADQGTDTVYAYFDFTLPQNVEVLNLKGSAIRGWGNSGEYWIYGNANNNTLDARSGSGHLFGSAGDDIYFVDSIGDSLTENAGEGTDTVYASLDFVLPQNAEVLNLVGAAVRGVGNSGEYWIYGNANNNVLDARGGTGHLFGGTGDDTYLVDGVSDQVIEGSSGGNDTIYADVTYGLNDGSEIETLSASGTSAVDLTGNSYGNTLIGNGAANILDGRGGPDTLWGLGGSDTFLLASLGNGYVTIGDFVSGLDRIAIRQSAFGLSGIGSLATAGMNFMLGTAASGGAASLVYDQTSGSLWFDADGAGAGQAIRIAALSGNPNATYNDFQVV